MAAVASQTVGLSIAAVSSTHVSNCIMIERESALYLLVCISVSPIICWCRRRFASATAASALWSAAMASIAWCAQYAARDSAPERGVACTRVMYHTYSSTSVHVVYELHNQLPQESPVSLSDRTVSPLCAGSAEGRRGGRRAHRLDHRPLAGYRRSRPPAQKAPLYLTASAARTNRSRAVALVLSVWVFVYTNTVFVELVSQYSFSSRTSQPVLYRLYLYPRNLLKSCSPDPS